MTIDDINIFTEQDKTHFAYALCVLGFVGAGATLGSMAGGLTLPLAAGGAVYGLYACKHVAEPLKQKLFSHNTLLSEPEFKEIFVSVRRQYPNASKRQLFDLIGSARLEAKNAPNKFKC